MLIAFTDGACSGNPGPGGWSVVLTEDGRTIKDTLSGGARMTTNNAMELTAILEAVKHVPADIHLEIRTDSANCIGWLQGGWKRKVPAIAQLCNEIDRAMGSRQGKVSFVKVAGHSGDPLNEKADVLAVAAAQAARYR